MPESESFKISKLKHRVALCTAHDVVTKNGTMELIRSTVVWTWADIEMQWNVHSFLSPIGFAIRESADRVTHYISVRSGIGVDVTSTAWIFEQRLKSQPRWYKVVGFGESPGWLTMSCHLVEKSDNLQPPVGHLTPIPTEAKL